MKNTLRRFTLRLKSLFVSDAALDRRAAFLARHAERKADLMRKAADYDEQGLPEIAEELRGQALAFSVDSQLLRLSGATDSFAPSSSPTKSPRKPIAGRNGAVPPARRKKAVAR